MSDESLKEKKDALRRKVRARLRILAPEDRTRAGGGVARHLLAHGLARRAAQDRTHGTPRPWALFASLSFEISTLPLDDALRAAGVPRALPALEEGRLVLRVLPPQVEVRELDPDELGIPTPPPTFRAWDPGACGLIVTPGLAFDEEGGRLGQGGGHYDRLLSAARRAPHPPLAIGVGFDFQRLSRVPMGPLDQRLDGLCSPTKGMALIS